MEYDSDESVSQYIKDFQQLLKQLFGWILEAQISFTLEDIPQQGVLLIYLALLIL